MKKTIAAITLTFCLTASTLGAVNANSAAASTTAAPDTAAASSAQTQTEKVSNEDSVKNSAGVLPTSRFYCIERGIEQLQLAITKSQDKLAALQAKFAAERAAEAVVLSNAGEDKLAGEAAVEYSKFMTSAVKNINTAIEDKEQAVKNLEKLNKLYSDSQALLKSLLANASKDTKEVIEAVLKDQDKAVTAVNEFYTVRKAYFEANNRLMIAQMDLQAAKNAGNTEAIKLAEEKVKTAEAVKDELKEIKKTSESAKKEIKVLEDQTKKLVKSGFKQIKQANTNVKIAEKKASQDTKKVEQKDKNQEKQLKKVQKEECKKIKKETVKAVKDPVKKVNKQAQKQSKNAGKYTKKTTQNSWTGTQKLSFPGKGIYQK